ncbi:hypothetical protein [Aquibacillus rhizosphaerae]|uniref:Uncharacterized protein n=1 Tax=Aquibacillus rhizosphaerae TaxID=3051431 RepID=A0ABT7LAC4_9BACI|nr:hypothetical protein [Aquibacillus sp. LR5S19]MDL4842818.1 hypothetical protein [Aquibacillus sp. LR5S19]
MKLLNPYTKSKSYNKNLLKKKLGNFIVNNKFLNKNKVEINFKLFDDDVLLPSDIRVEINHILMSEIVFMEDFNRLKKGLHKLFKLNQNQGYYYFNPRNIDDFFERLFSNIRSRNIQNTFKMTIKDVQLRKFCKELTFSLASVSNSIVAINIHISPSDNFKTMISEAMKGDTDKGFIQMIPPRYIKDTLKPHSWQTVSFNKQEYKLSLIEDLILELKWEVSCYLSKYLPLYFFKNKVISPSIEVYNTHLISLPLQGNELLSKMESAGIFSSFLCESNERGDIHLVFNDDFQNNRDISIKMHLNEVYNENHTSTISNKIIPHIANPYLIQLLSIQTMTKLYEKRTLKHKKKYDKVSSINLPKLVKYRMLSRLKIEMEKNNFHFSRLDREINYEFYEYMIKRYEREVGKTTNILKSYKLSETLTNVPIDIFDQSNFMFKSIYDQVTNQIHFLDNIINFKRQSTMLILTVITIVISLLTLIFTLLTFISTFE